LAGDSFLAGASDFFSVLATSASPPNNPQSTLAFFSAAFSTPAYSFLGFFSFGAFSFLAFDAFSETSAAFFGSD